MADDPEHEASETLLEEARERMKLCLETGQKQRDRETEDLRFQIPELQWRDEDRQARRGDGKSIAPRPTLSISLLDQPRQLLLNQFRQADLGVEIHPVSEDADQDTAEAIQGIYRHIERKSKAIMARFWGYNRASACGRGCYRVLTEYDDEGGDPSDQRIVIKRIFHQESVYFDPAAQEADYRDGEFVFICAWLSEDEFERRYPRKNAQIGGSGWLEGLKAQAPEWVDADDVLVAEYWYKKHSKGERDDVEVYRVLLNGWEVLEGPTKWPGKYIPIIPVIGREMVPFDKEHWYSGLITPAKDAQRFSNTAASTFVERMNLEPKAPWVGPAQAFEGYERMWEQANVRNWAYLPYNIGTNPQAPVPPPQRAEINLQGESLAAQALQIAQGWIQSATAVFDPSLGRLPEKDRSGKAIMALQQQADAGTGDFLENFTDISLLYEADVILDLIPKVYDRPGRITRIIKGDQGKTEPIMLNRPFKRDDRGFPRAYVPPKVTQRPYPASMPPPQSMMMPPGGMMPGGMPPQPQQAPQKPAPAAGQLPEGVKHYDLTKGVYNVSVSVGKSFQTRRQEGFEKMSQFLGQEPTFFVALGDLLLRYADWPGSDDMAKRMVKLRDQQMPFLRDDAENGPPADQLKSQLTQMGQQMQMQGQALQQAIQMIQSKQAEQQAKIEVAQIAAQAQLMKAQMDNETKLALANMEAKFTGDMEQIKLLIQHDHENRNAISDKFHETVQQDKEHMHEAAMAQMQAGQAAGQARDQQKHEVAMSQITEPGPEAPEAPEPTEVPAGNGGAE